MDEMTEAEKTRETAKSIEAFLDQATALNYCLNSCMKLFASHDEPIGVSDFHQAVLRALRAMLDSQQDQLENAQAYIKVLAGEIEDTKDEQKDE